MTGAGMPSLQGAAAMTQPPPNFQMWAAPQQQQSMPTMMTMSNPTDPDLGSQAPLDTGGGHMQEQKETTCGVADPGMS